MIDAVAKIGFMWEWLGNRFKEKAVIAVGTAKTGADIDRAIDFAAAAEICFWRATGEAEPIKDRKGEL